MPIDVESKRASTGTHWSCRNVKASTNFTGIINVHTYVKKKRVHAALLNATWRQQLLWRLPHTLSMWVCRRAGITEAIKKTCSNNTLEPSIIILFAMWGVIYDNIHQQQLWSVLAREKGARKNSDKDDG